MIPLHCDKFSSNSVDMMKWLREVLHFKMSTYLMHCVGVYSGPPKPRYAGGRCPLPNSDRIRAVKRSPCPPLPQILRFSYGPEIGTK